MATNIISAEHLTPDEKLELINLETTIDRHFYAFIEVGHALMQIRVNRLYRATHPTFEQYCSKRWGFNSSRARQLISAAEVHDNLKSVTGVTQLKEFQIRPLVKLPPEMQRKVFQKAVETAPDGKVTAEHVEKTIEDMKMAEKANTGSPNQDTLQEDNVFGTPGTIETKEDSKALAHLKSCWRRANNEDRKAFLLWIKEKEEKNGKESEQTSIDFVGYNEAMAS